MSRIAVFQMRSGIDPQANAAAMREAVAGASAGGADILFTPEMSGMLDRKRGRAAEKIVSEAEDTVLQAMQEEAKAHSIWIALGSLAVAREDGKWANRSFLIGPDGAIAARYDKIHMFDVALDTGESWRESSAYERGEEVVHGDDTPVGRLGLAVCYDMRFPALFGALGNASCDAIAVPAAFTRPTGKAHWHVLLRARAIEASAFVIAAAQCGEHEDGRATYGHSLVVDPWGEVLLDMGGEGPGLGFAEIDSARIEEVRSQLPSLANRVAISRSAS